MLCAWQGWLELKAHAQAAGHACPGCPRFAAEVKPGKAPRLVGNPEACLQDARIARAEAPGQGESPLAEMAPWTAIFASLP